ncbi:MAG: hypothetical protein ACK2U5_15815 [Candidatus Promineifilaceae bacterium]|jgi:uncharacterized membrane protein
MNAVPRKLILFALLLLIVGAVVPFLTMIGVLESTFATNFVAYFSSVVGLFLGFIGIAMYVGNARRNDDWHDY